AYFVNGVSFLENSNAGNGNFTLNAPTSSSVGGVLVFSGTTSAANGIFTVYEDAEVIFGTDSTAGNATLIADGGGLIFQNTSIGGTARVELLDKGTLYIKFHNLPNITIGSLEGRGVVELGQRNLTIGNNDLSTVFSSRVKGFGSL